MAVRAPKCVCARASDERTFADDEVEGDEPRKVNVNATCVRDN